MAKIALGCDHAGFELKQQLAACLQDWGYEVIDLGTHSSDRVDYPDYGAAVGQAVAGGQADVGVAVCGSGIGIAMAANKIPGIRAATVHDTTTAELSRLHNDANVACFGERLTEPAVAIEALKVFLETGFEGGRHEARVGKLNQL